MSVCRQAEEAEQEGGGYKGFSPVRGVRGREGGLVVNPDAERREGLLEGRRPLGWQRGWEG